MKTEKVFTVFPAIDLRDGKVVRLAQGQPDQQTVFGDNPRAWAERWKAEGAEWLHIINLSGAFDEDESKNFKALESILGAGMKVEYGGGIRDKTIIHRVIEMGVERVFLGTVIIENPALVEWAIAQYGPGRIAGDIGARAGKLSIKGWQFATDLSILDAGEMFRRLGLEWCVLTDVARDGVSSGVNIASAVELQEKCGLQVVASGGVRSLVDVKAARQAGLAGVIIGRALYEKKVSLKDCIIGAA